jgi:hypothetical protein
MRIDRFQINYNWTAVWKKTNLHKQNSVWQLKSTHLGSVHVKPEISTGNNLFQSARQFTTVLNISNDRVYI